MVVRVLQVAGYSSSVILGSELQLSELMGCNMISKEEVVVL